MASVTSLDSDMRSLRLSKYTPAASNRVRAWIEEVLGERLPPGDLLDALKDGVALCKLVNLAVGPPGIKYKQSQMPFVQMENISHFLKACELPPLEMPSHDRFLTVDLYESKDPAQVLQCLGAFSRNAHALNPSRFPSDLDGRKGGSTSQSAPNAAQRGTASAPLHPATSISAFRSSPQAQAARPISPVRTGGSNTSNNAGPVSSWANKGDQSNTAPAWNFAQYGYMGGASQGNQGVTFGGRRQITSAGPHVPSLAEKEKRRKEKEVEEQRAREEAEEAERQKRLAAIAEEQRARAEEEQRWEEETRRQREEERKMLEEERRQLEEQRLQDQVRQERERREEEKCQEEDRLRKEEARQQEEAAKIKSRPTDLTDARLNGQYLSQYQAGQKEERSAAVEDTPEARRVRELERQLEQARERERQYQMEREQRDAQKDDDTGRRNDKIETPSSPPASDRSWAADEQEVLQQAGPRKSAFGSTRPLPVPSSLSSQPANRSEPDMTDFQAKTTNPNRTDRFLAENKPPAFQRPQTHQPREMGTTSTSEEHADRDRRIASQEKTKAGGWASKSLLEREMERERERQKEWEANQESTKAAARDLKEGSSPGHTWNVNQYGFTGGDNQNKGSSTGSGIAFGGRRQIIGPRPQPGAK